MFQNEAKMIPISALIFSSLVKWASVQIINSFPHECNVPSHICALNDKL